MEQGVAWEYGVLRYMGVWSIEVHTFVMVSVPWHHVLAHQGYCS